jgi:hypothetical protein
LGVPRIHRPCQTAYEVTRDPPVSTSHRPPARASAFAKRTPWLSWTIAFGLMWWAGTFRRYFDAVIPAFLARSHAVRRQTARRRHRTAFPAQSSDQTPTSIGCVGHRDLFTLARFSGPLILKAQSVGLSPVHPLVLRS